MKAPPTVHADLITDLAAALELLADIRFEVERTMGMDELTRAGVTECVQRASALLAAADAMVTRPALTDKELKSKRRVA